MMTSALWIGLPILIMSWTLMFLLPQFAPRRYFFAITVPANFRASREAQAIERRYHRELGIALACSVALLAALASKSPDIAIVLSFLLPVLSGFALFLIARNQVRPYAAPASSVREAELTDEADRLPGWILWGLPPFGFLAGTALYLRAHWSQMPERFPVHWDLAGNINGWGTRTPAGVYGVLAIAAVTMLLMLLIGAGMFYGARRSPQRSTVLKMLIACTYLLGLVFSWVGLLPLVQVPAVAIVVVTTAFTVVILVWSFRMVKDPRMPTEVTPDECWYLGGFYYNRADPAIFIQKRIGFGYTLNLGNPVTWLVSGGFIAGMVGLVLLR
jgi:uncharacterized membrane protein